MAGSRPTDTFGPVRSRLIAVAEYLRARPIAGLRRRRGRSSLLVFLPFHYVTWTAGLHRPAGDPGLAHRRRRRGLAAARASAALLAIVGGVAYDLLAISDRWLVPGATTAAVLVLWLVAGLGVGLLGDRYRGQVARALDQAHRSRDALDRVVGATPLFHARGGPSAVARAICDVALETFDCDLVALFAIEGERLRLLARSPFLANSGDRLLMEPSTELQEELAENLLPQFVHDVREPFGPRMPRAITADPGAGLGDPRAGAARRAAGRAARDELGATHAGARARRARRGAALRRARRRGARAGAARPGAAGRGRALPPLPGEPLARRSRWRRRTSRSPPSTAPARDACCSAGTSSTR